MYRSEQRVGKIALTFAALTMFIACLGLFGLVTYIAEQRTKEIGVRKVLGASTFNIVSLLSNDLLLLVLLAILIAFPLAYYFMQTWLQNFAYGVSISPWVFVYTGFGAILVAFATIGYKAVLAALTDPIISLKTE
jgi:putative ABC transport system permease protein